MKSKAMYRSVFAVAAAVVFIASTPVLASETDKDIEPAFKNTYVYRTYLKDDAISTEAKEGVVTLSGTVSDEFHKALAQEAVLSLPGVISVDNQLATKAEVAADNADTWISRKVKFTLLLHRNVNAGQTAVEVNNGIVTLTGQASSVAQKDLTTEYVNDIDGVKVVNNNMTVAAAPVMAEQTAGEKMDDASVIAQVKTALLIHRSTSATKTKVESRDGVVTLTGIAKNAAEISLVTKLVSDIQGVNSVKNEMTVEAAK